jgi:hypothetical protein
MIPPSASEPVTLHIDIMFVEKAPYLISVGSPMPVTLVTNLAGQRSAAPVAKALQDHINKYLAARKDIFAIFSDGEGAIAKLTGQLNQRGIIVNISGAGAHAPIIERRIRMIKERVRGVLSTLAFNLPQSLFKYLVAFAVASQHPRVRYFTERMDHWNQAGLQKGSAIRVWRVCRGYQFCDNTT